MADYRFYLDRVLTKKKSAINPLLQYLIAGWKFEDNYDDILGNNNGTSTGTIPFIDYAIGKGVDLRTTSNIITLDNNIPFEIGYSLCFYIDLSSIGNIEYIVGAKSSTFVGGIYHQEGIRIFDGGRIGQVVYATTDFITHVTITRTGIGTYDVFINSDFTGQINLTTAAITINIGGFGARRLLLPQFFATTILDEIYVFNKILTQEEIQLAMQGIQL